MNRFDEVSLRPSFRVPIVGAPPLTGWAVQYKSGMENHPEIKSGYWLSLWRPSDGLFNFEPDLWLCFEGKEEANCISGTLRKFDIETDVVHVG